MSTSNIKYLLTGSNGFLSGYILSKISPSDITTLDISNADIVCDLAINKPYIHENIDVLIHAAGKAHVVPRTENEKQLIFDVNVQGTKNLCTAFEKSGMPKAIIFISTVAVYGLDFGENITEEYPLNGTTPYALSKIQAEHFLQEWCAKHNVTLGIIRPSLIAGKNPPGYLGAMIKGIKSGRYLRIGDGETKKSVLMAEDIARIIPKLAEIGGIYNICDDHHPSLAELETLIANQMGKKRPLSIPYWSAKCLALMGDLLSDKFPINSLKLDKLVKPLTFSNEKAKRELNWQPLDVLNNFKIQ